MKLNEFIKYILAQCPVGSIEFEVCLSRDGWVTDVSGTKVTFTILKEENTQSST